MGTTASWDHAYYELFYLMMKSYKIKLLFDNPNATLPDRFFITNNMINFGRCFTLDIPSEVKDLTVPLHITTL